MALSDILGNLISSGMGGRNNTGPNFMDQLHQSNNQSESTNRDSGAFGTGLSYGKIGSLAGVAAIAYKAYTAHQEKERDRAAWVAQGGQPAQQSSITDKITSWFGHKELDAKQSAIPDQNRSLLLISAMITASAADGVITASERNAIMQQVDNSNPSDEDRHTIEKLLNNPVPINDLFSQVHDQNTAEQVYYSACVGMQQNSTSAAQFLPYVAEQLNIPADRQTVIKNALYNQ